MSVRPSAVAGVSGSLPIVDDESCDFLCKMGKGTLAMLSLTRIDWKLDVSQCRRDAVGSSRPEKLRRGAREVGGDQSGQLTLHCDRLRSRKCKVEKRFSIRSVEEKSPHDGKSNGAVGESERKGGFDCRGRREVLGAQKVGGLVRLIKGKAEGGTGSWALG